MDLLNKIATLKNLKLHVFGHIHECPGIEEIRGTKFVNATIMNEWYEPVNQPIRIEL
jgi:Icc-related predicted phosphoesterase